MPRKGRSIGGCHPLGSWNERTGERERSDYTGPINVVEGCVGRGLITQPLTTFFGQQSLARERGEPILDVRPRDILSERAGERTRVVLGRSSFLLNCHSHWSLPLLYLTNLRTLKTKSLGRLSIRRAIGCSLTEPDSFSS